MEFVLISLILIFIVFPLTIVYCTERGYQARKTQRIKDNEVWLMDELSKPKYQIIIHLISGGIDTSEVFLPELRYPDCYKHHRFTSLDVVNKKLAKYYEIGYFKTENRTTIPIGNISKTTIVTVDGL